LTQMNKGDYAMALDYFTRALIYTPNYTTLEINLGVVTGELGDRGDVAHHIEAERHFLRAIQLAPADDGPHAFYGRWLERHGRAAEAITQLRMAIAIDPPRLMQHDLLIETYALSGDMDSAQQAARDALAIAPDDTTAQNILLQRGRDARANAKAPGVLTADDYVNESLRLNHEGKYQESLAAARKALQLDPHSARAWNNIAANDEALHRWDDAVAASRQALALEPDLQIAKNNLAWSIAQKASKH
jgi:uncharacterized protein (TIGR02996 family)